MANLEMRKNSSWWYVRYRKDGVGHAHNLGVKVRGMRPASSSGQGDRDFERSRAEAMAALTIFERDLKEPRRQEELAQVVIEARTGKRVGEIDLAELCDRWESWPRRRAPSPRYAFQCRSTLTRFVTYLQGRYPQISKMHEVSEEAAKEFLAAEYARGVTDKTWNDTLKLLRATFKHLLREAGMMHNPFETFVTKEVETEFRHPFTPEELKDIFDCAKADPFIEPIIITAACTAMRRGDCCRLKWSAVDLAEGFIKVKTSKTRAVADIPIFPMLYDQLKQRVGNGSEFVFPEQAEKYESNPDRLTQRMRKVLLAAGFYDGSPTDGRRLTRTDLDVPAIKKKAGAWFATLPPSKRTVNIQRTLDLYLQGLRACKVAATMGISKASVSGYLNEVERKIGMPLVRGKIRSTALIPVKRGDVQKVRERGLRNASIRDFHSFRTTWITLALTSNIPLDLVQRVTGHRTTEVVMKHYFRPHREQLKKALQQLMPSLLTAGAGSSTDNAIALLRSVTSENWQRIVREAIAFLGGGGTMLAGQSVD